MDLDYIQRKARAAREYTTTLDAQGAPRTFQLREPTKHQSVLAGLRCRADAGTPGVAMVLLGRALLLECIVGWQGVLISDLLPVAPEGQDTTQPFAFDPAAIELLLDTNPHWEQQLWSGLVDRMARRDGVFEEAAKN